MSFRAMVVGVMVLAVSAQSSEASVPKSITVQGRLTDAAGDPLPVSAKTFRFRIFSAEVGGAQLWPAAFETQMLTPDVQGLWSTDVGAFNDLPDSVFADTVRWLEIEVDGTVLPRVRLVTGPYAYRVSTVDGASGGTINSKVSIGPGHTNTGTDAFVAGAVGTASGNYSTVSGGNQNTASGGNSTVGGGLSNTASAANATVAGGILNVASGNHAAVTGGQGNDATGDVSHIGGGSNNTASGEAATIGGGVQNYASGQSAFIGSGSNNIAGGLGVVVGGLDNDADSVSVVGGGYLNSASAVYTAIVGGLSNEATAPYAAVLGGWQNSAQGEHSTVGGGINNIASGLISVIAGGSDNAASFLNATVGGGALNTAGGIAATVGGGENNSVGGNHATIPGGRSNQADGNYSFAAGRRAKALDAGCFVWADRTDADFASTDPDQFLIRATGGVGIGVDSPFAAIHIAPGPDNLSLYFGTGAQDIVWNSTQPLQLGQWDGAAFTERMRISSGGHIGIGETVTPNLLTLPDLASTEGRGLANAWSVYSSRRWKDSIATIEGALSKVEQLRGVTYVHKSDGAHDIGLIAEEVGGVIPEVVQYEANGVDAQSVDYARLVALLIEGMKEQQVLIEKQQHDIEMLKSAIQP